MVTKTANGAPNGHQMAERKKTKYQGVYVTESSRRHNGKPDLIYVIDYRDAAGNRQRKTVGRSSAKMTAALASQIRTRIVNEQQGYDIPDVAADLAPKEIITFGEAWKRYRRDWLEAYGKSTQNEDSLIKTHLSCFTALPLSEITAYRIDALMSDMLAKGLSPQYTRHTASLVRRIMRKMRKWELYDGQDPFLNITLPKLNNGRERYLTPEEARLLLGELRKRSETTWLMSLISLHCGLRFGEVAALTFGDIDFNAGTLFIRESKSGKGRHAVMTDEVMAALRVLPRAPHTALLFPSSTGGKKSERSCTFRRAVDALGLNDTGRMLKLPNGKTVPEKITDNRRRVVFHTLRHTYASWLAMAGEREMSLAELLGHTSTAMTKRYVHLMDSARRGTANKISSVFHSPAPKND